MMREIKCPACGGSDFEFIDITTSSQAPYGPLILEINKIYKCKICDSEFDYNDLTGDKKESSLKISEKHSIDEMLDDLSKNGHSWAAIERSLDLPQRTISRWKNNKDISSIGIALLRIIRTYPWIIQVAAQKFNPVVAKQIYLQNAIEELISISVTYKSFISRHFDIESSSQQGTFYYYPENRILESSGIKTATKKSGITRMEF